jgi:putative ABC transport system ATP-binding protein
MTLQGLIGAVPGVILGYGVAYAICAHLNLSLPSAFNSYPPCATTEPALKLTLTPSFDITGVLVSLALTIALAVVTGLLAGRLPWSRSVSHSPVRRKSMSNPLAIHLQDVKRVYPRADETVCAVDGVTLSVPSACTVAITGPSGSGKSTLLALTAGLDPATEGRIEVFGQDVTAMNEDQRADFRRENIGFVFQNYHLLPTLSVWENVMMPLIPSVSDKLELKARALQWIERVGLEKRINHLPGELSGGEQQRVGLARALIGEPTLILADEPTGNLDSDNAGSILDLLFELSTGGHRSVVLSTHDQAVAGRCQHHVRLEAGKVVSSTLEEV